MSPAPACARFRVVVAITVAVLACGFLATTQAEVQAAQGPGPLSRPARIGAALDLLDQTPGYRHVRDVFELNAVRLDFGVLRPETAALYQEDQRVVLLNARWLQVDLRALAAVLVHEAVHVADSAALGSGVGAGCADQEAWATIAEASAWARLVGSSGKADPVNDLERALNRKLGQLSLNDPAAAWMVGFGSVGATACAA